MNKISNVVSKLLSLLEVSATKTTIAETLNSHPHYPSLLSVRDTLLSLRVPNMSYNLEPQHLLELPTPCIVHLKEGYKEEFTVLKEIKQNQVVHLKDQHWITEPILEFEKRWSGVAMLVEPNESSGEQNFLQSRIKELIKAIRIPLLIILLTSALFRGYLTHVHQTWQWWLLLIINAIGMMIGLLLMTEFFYGSSYIKKVCNINANFDCTSVLKSKYAKLLGVISWSELVYFYYTGSFLWITLSHQHNMVLGSLFYLNLFTLPFTFYSIYYQFFVQKKICLLCTSIVFLLWNETYLLYPHYQNLNITGEFVYVALLSFLSPLTAWSLLKPWIVKLQLIQKKFDSAQKIKMNPDLFATILQQQEKMPSLEGINPLILGYHKSQHIITVVTNPQCDPCRELHQKITRLIEQNPDVK